MSKVFKPRIVSLSHPVGLVLAFWCFVSLSVTAEGTSRDDPELLWRWETSNGGTLLARMDQSPDGWVLENDLRRRRPTFFIYRGTPPHDQELAVRCIQWRTPQNGDWVLETDNQAEDAWWTERGYRSKTFVGWAFRQAPENPPAGYAPVPVFRWHDDAHRWVSVAGTSSPSRGGAWERDRLVCWALKKTPSSEEPTPGADATRAWPSKLRFDSLNLALNRLPAGSHLVALSERAPLDPARIGPAYEYRSLANLTVSRPVWVSQREITLPQFSAILEQDVPSVGERHVSSAVSGVSTQDALAFCQALTQELADRGLLPEGYAFRLPRREEFSLALASGASVVDPLSRAGMFELGISSPIRKRQEFLQRQAVTWVDAVEPGITSNDTKDPNQLGLFDLFGNLEEIVTDASGSEFYRAGGSWYHRPEDFEWAASYRPISRSYRSNLLGFRVVLAPMDEQAIRSSPRPNSGYYIRNDTVVREWNLRRDEPVPAIVDLEVTEGGVIWIASKGALMRARDRQLDIFRSGDLRGLPHHVVTSIAPGEDGRIWALNERLGQVTLYDERGRFYSTHVDSALERLGDLFMSHRSGQVWLMSYNGLWKTKSRLHKITRNPASSTGFDVRDFGSDELGPEKFWAARAAGEDALVVASNDAEYWRVDLNSGHREEMISLGKRRYVFLTADDEGRVFGVAGPDVFIGNRGGVQSRFRINDSFAVKATTRGALLPDGRPVVQIGNALVIRENEKWFHAPVEPVRKGAVVWDTDRHGGLWVGAPAHANHLYYPFDLSRPTGDHEIRGLWRVSFADILTLNEKSGMTPGHGWSACPDGEGGVWLITTAGLTHWTAQGEILPYCGPRIWLQHGRGLNCVYSDSKKRVWLGLKRSGYLAQASDGAEGFKRSPVLRFEGHRWSHLMLPFSGEDTGWINVIYEDSRGVMWFGAKHGLIRYEGPEDVELLTSEDGLPGNDVRIVHEDRGGRFWIGTHGSGLALFDPDTREVRRFTREDGLSGDVINSVLEDPDGTLWFGTEDGLTRVRGVSLAAVTSEDGLFGEVINQAFESQFGDLWIGCLRGIFRVPKDQLNAFCDGERERVSCETFGKTDGMDIPETNGEQWPAGCVTAAGDLVFPTINGFAIIQPERFEDSDTPAAAFVHHVTARSTDRDSDLNERQIELDTHSSSDAPELSFAPRIAESLEFTFGATDLEAPDQVAFRYLLLGLDDEWREIGRKRRVFFGALPPGDYAFQVAAQNHNRVWGPASEPIPFTIRPYFYETPVFQWGSGLGLLGLGVFAHQLATTARRRKRELVRTVEFNRQRDQITRDIHDEIGTDIARMTFCARSLKTGARFDPGEVETLAERLQSLGRESMNNLRRILWTADPEKDSPEQLVSYLVRFFDSTLADHPIRRRIDVPTETPTLSLSPTVRHHVVLIIREAVNNLIRHAQAHEASLRIRLNAQQVEIEISDDGVGLLCHRSDTHEGHGLGNMRRRAELIGGQLEIADRDAGGVSVLLRYPFDN